MDDLLTPLRAIREVAYTRRRVALPANLSIGVVVNPDPEPPSTNRAAFDAGITVQMEAVYKARVTYYNDDEYEQGVRTLRRQMAHGLYGELRGMLMDLEAELANRDVDAARKELSRVFDAINL